MKKIIYLILLISFSIGAKANNPYWKMHPIFDEAVEHVVETPDYVYFTSRNLMEVSGREIYQCLFRYDKAGDELMELSTTNILNGNQVRDVVYNPDKGYLAVLYKDYNLDLLYNNGTVINIPDYANSTLTYSKGVNSMTTDGANDRLYLATDFGYVAINDKKNEVAESRIYGEPLSSFCRLGDNYYIIKGEEILSAPVSSPRLSLDQYEIEGTATNPKYFLPLDSNLALLVCGEKNNRSVKKMSVSNDGIQIEDALNGYFHNIDKGQNGIVLTSGSRVYKFDKNGNYDTVELPEPYYNSTVGTTNMSDFWAGCMRKGLSSIKKSGEQWNVTRNWMLPNSPATYVTNSFADHPSKGLLMLSHGYTPSTISLYNFAPIQLSGYKQGKWSNYAPAYTNPDRTTILNATNGIIVDPDNNNYVYVSSYHNGFARFNLNDPKDIIHFAKPSDADAANDGFIALDYVTDRNYATTTAPRFDKRGNMWMYFADYDHTEDPKLHYMYWSATDRRSTTSAKDAKLPKHIEFKASAPINNAPLTIPLHKTGNGLHVFTELSGETFLILYDTNGTPFDTSDDKTYNFSHMTDSDGAEMSLGRVRDILEDPATGYVWLAHENGVCYFVPNQVMAGSYYLNRVKVPRNDGTNLADYLLEGVTVNQITIDGDGRKWFATNGGGVICTSSDGREILEEFNTFNSPLPSDEVYGAGYNSADNSLMFSTSAGYIEYSLPKGQSMSAKEDIKAYPNPVRPEYTGFVTITDIPQGSFVKITDSVGNLVKELGTMTGFEILWDISDFNYNRVKSGVYHIMVSPSDEESSFAKVGKILVIS